MQMDRRAKFLLSIGIFAIAVVAGSLLMSRASGLSVWVTASIVAVALVLNGLLLGLEDDLPGGFSNPSGADTPRYVKVVAVVVHVILVLACGALAVLFLLLADQAGWSTARGLALTAFSIGSVCGYVAIKHNRRWGLAGLAIFVACPILILWMQHDG